MYLLQIKSFQLITYNDHIHLNYLIKELLMLFRKLIIKLVIRIILPFIIIP